MYLYVVQTQIYHRSEPLISGKLTTPYSPKVSFQSRLRRRLREKYFVEDSHVVLPTRPIRFPTLEPRRSSGLSRSCIGFIECSWTCSWRSMRVSPRLASVVLPASRSLNNEGAECCNHIFQPPIGAERSLARKLFDRRTGESSASAEGWRRMLCQRMGM